MTEEGDTKHIDMSLKDDLFITYDRIREKVTRIRLRALGSEKDFIQRVLPEYTNFDGLEDKPTLSLNDAVKVLREYKALTEEFVNIMLMEELISLDDRMEQHLFEHPREPKTSYHEAAILWKKSHWHKIISERVQELKNINKL